MTTVEEVIYDAGRAALADQEAFVAGIRQRTGTLLAAHALVASFLGGTALRVHGFHVWEWLAMAALVCGLVIAAAVLAPWNLKFAVDADDLYDRLSSLEEDGTLGWLAAAGFAYDSLRSTNADKVASTSRMSAGVAVLMVAETLLWLAALGLD